MTTNDAVKDIQKGISEILVAIAVMQTEIKQLGSVANKQEQTEKTVIKAMESAKAAHKRLDEFSKDHDDLNKKIDESIKKIDESKKEIENKIESDKKNNKDDKKWIIGLVPGAIALVWNLLKGGGSQ